MAIRFHSAPRRKGVFKSVVKNKQLVNHLDLWGEYSVYRGKKDVTSISELIHGMKRKEKEHLPHLYLDRSILKIVLFTARQE